MKTIVSIVCFLALTCVNYKILEQRDKSYAFRVNIILYIIVNFLTTFSVFGAIISGLISGAILTSICSFAHKKSNSFIGYIGRIILIDIIIVVIIIAIIFSGMSVFNSGLGL